MKDRILRCKDCDKAPIVLVANKIDLANEREVSRKEGEELAKQYEMPFFETSAKNKINVDEIFYQAVKIHVQGPMFSEILTLEREKEELRSWQILEKQKVKKKVRKIK